LLLRKPRALETRKVQVIDMGEEALMMIEGAEGGQISQGAGAGAEVIPPADIRNPEREAAILREEEIEDDLDD
jgi:hypothetical protein|tara:strand:- start:424 stop:642 length:219 start_codon:yes stop_codon:yes gene_type:complete